MREPLAWADVTVAGELELFLRPRYRHAPGGAIKVPCDGVSSLGHVVQELGVPLTEVGGMAVNGVPARPGYRPTGGDAVRVEPVLRPQPLADARFVLDVHLGTLARRLRLLGIDSAYANDADDDALIELACEEERVLLTQDRGLLCRRALSRSARARGAFVRGARSDAQIADVLDRFAPPLAPWTRCPGCNGLLREASKTSVDPVLKPGTRRCYESFARCEACGHVYWRGAHSDHLQAIIDSAAATVAARLALAAATEPPAPGAHPSGLSLRASPPQLPQNPPYRARQRGSSVGFSLAGSVCNSGSAQLSRLSQSSTAGA